MSDFLKIESDAFDLRLQNINEEYTNFLLDELVTESVSDSFAVKTKRFFVNLIAMIRRFIDDIKAGVESKSRELHYRNSLKEKRKTLEKAKEEGKKKVIMTDMKTVIKTYNDAYKELSGLAKKFVSMKYTDIDDLDKDLDKFTELNEKLSKKIDDSLDKTITVDIDEAIKFIDKELSGNSFVYDKLNELITDIKTIERDVESTYFRRDYLGNGIITERKVGPLQKIGSSIQRITSAISAFVKKWVVRIVFAVVFTFA